MRTSKDVLLTVTPQSLSPVLLICTPRTKPNRVNHYTLADYARRTTTHSTFTVTRISPSAHCKLNVAHTPCPTPMWDFPSRVHHIASALGGSLGGHSTTAHFLYFSSASYTAQENSVSLWLSKLRYARTLTNPSHQIPVTPHHSPQTII